MLLIEVPTLTDVNFLHLIRSGWSSLLLEWLPSRRCWWVSTILWEEEEGMLWWSVKLGFQQIGWEVVGLKLQPCIVGIYSMSLGDSTAHSWTYVESWDLHYGRFLLRESDMVIWNIFTNTMHCTLSSSNHGRDNIILLCEQWCNISIHGNKLKAPIILNFPDTWVCSSIFLFSER